MEQQLQVQEEIKEIEHFTNKILKQFDSKIECYCPLKDGRLAFGFEDKTIKIINQKNNFSIDLTLEGHTKTVCSIGQMDDGKLVSCSKDNTIRLWSYGKDTYKNEFTIENCFTGPAAVNQPEGDDSNILSVTPISNNRVVAFSAWNTLKIFSLAQPYDSKPLFEKENVSVPKYLKEKDLLVTTSGDIKSTIFFYDMKNYQLKSAIENGGCWISQIYEVDSEKVLLGGECILILLNLNDCKIQKMVKVYNLGFVSSFLKIGDKKIACGTDKGLFVIEDYTSDKLVVTKQKEEKEISIFDLIPFDKDTFISTDYDKAIREWKIKH